MRLYAIQVSFVAALISLCSATDALAKPVKTGWLSGKVTVDRLDKSTQRPIVYLVHVAGAVPRKARPRSIASRP